EHLGGEDVECLADAVEDGELLLPFGKSVRLIEAGLRRGRRNLFLDRREGLGEVAHLFEAAGRVFGVPEHCAVPGGVSGAEPEGPEFTRFDEQVTGMALV